MNSQSTSREWHSPVGILVLAAAEKMIIRKPNPGQGWLKRVSGRHGDI